MIKTISSAALSALLLAACTTEQGAEPKEAAPAEAQAQGAETAASEISEFETVDYRQTENWLCHPDKPDDACDIERDHTVVSADGALEVVPFKPSQSPAIDCFYIYPTVSMDETANSDLSPGAEEMRVIESQFAQFGKVCRLYAPLYRQMTIPELRRAMFGGERQADEAMRWSDVKGAWDTYLENYNDGRGVVLIGHSQGAHMVDDLVKKEIAGSDAEDRVLSVMPIGWTIYPDAASGGVGPFEPCNQLGQTGCSVSYVTFRSTSPPPSGSLFGVSARDGERALCVNPAAITDENGALDARLSARNWVTNEPAELTEGGGVDTPFASVPGLLSGRCVEADKHTYLEIEVNGDPGDPRTDDIAGDLVFAGLVLPDWGLHLVDMNVAMGDLLSIVEAQGDSWAAEVEDEDQAEH